MGSGEPRRSSRLQKQQVKEEKEEEEVAPAARALLPDGEDDSEWVPGQSDLRARGALLCRAMARLYRLRGYDNDFRRAIHWYKIANFLQDFEAPICTEEEVADLIHYSGVGARTVAVLTEICVTGYLDYLDDLLAELTVIRDEQDATVVDIRANVQDLAEHHAEQRRHYLADRAQDTHLSVEDLVKTGVILSGKDRRELEAKPEMYPDTEAKTRHQKKRKTLCGALLTDACAICMDDYEDTDRLVVFQCKHCFHCKCIVPWLQARMEHSIQPSCPLCRTAIA